MVKEGQHMGNEERKSGKKASSGKKPKPLLMRGNTPKGLRHFSPASERGTEPKAFATSGRAMTQDTERGYPATTPEKEGVTIESEIPLQTTRADEEIIKSETNRPTKNQLDAVIHIYLQKGI